jgi:hypothetical protein
MLVRLHCCVVTPTQAGVHGQYPRVVVHLPRRLSFSVNVAKTGSVMVRRQRLDSPIRRKKIAKNADSAPSHPDWIREHGGVGLGMANPGATRIALIGSSAGWSLPGTRWSRRVVAITATRVCATERVRVVRQTPSGCAFGSDDFLALAGTSFLRSTKSTVSPNLLELTEGALRLRTIYP